MPTKVVSSQGTKPGDGCPTPATSYEIGQLDEVRAHQKAEVDLIEIWAEIAQSSRRQLIT